MLLLQIRTARSDPRCEEFLKTEVRNETRNVMLDSRVERKRGGAGADLFILTVTLYFT